MRLASPGSVTPHPRAIIPQQRFVPRKRQFPTQQASRGICFLLPLLCLTACRTLPPATGTATILIESSPNSLDPRIGTDAQSERINGLLYDPLFRLDAHFDPQPWLVQSVDHPDALTFTFHLRDGIRFHDGRPLEAADVAWTLHSLSDGTLITSKSGAFTSIAAIDTPNRLTLTLHLKHPDPALLFNLSDGLFGVVPRGSGRDLAQHPVGSGPFLFRSNTIDREVDLDRNSHYWADALWPSRGNLQHLQMPVIPDAVTEALELKKGSADAEVNALPLDTVAVLARTPGLANTTAPSSYVMYLNFNTRSGPLADKRVRQAIAFAMDRPAILAALWRGHARLAETLLPPEHWAAAPLSTRPRDLPRAQALLQAAGYPTDAQGIRLHLEMKTSQDESTRLLAVVLQQQLRAAGIALAIRSSEFGTFYSDVTRGAFQMYALRWIGSNESPDIFRYTLSTAGFPPAGGNRGHFSNPTLDALLQQAAQAPDRPTQHRLYLQAQQLLADELPVIPLWYPDNNIVHTTRLTEIHPDAAGSFQFLREAHIKTE